MNTIDEFIRLEAAEKLAEAVGEAVAKAHSGGYVDADDFLADIETAFLQYEKAGEI